MTATGLEPATTEAVSEHSTFFSPYMGSCECEPLHDCEFLTWYGFVCYLYGIEQQFSLSLTII